MRMTKVLALAATALLALPLSQAVTSVTAIGKTGVESSVTYTAGKKSKKKVASYKACGAFMYRKDGKCVDARVAKK
jgi:hypothetical protein